MQFGIKPYKTGRKEGQCDVNSPCWQKAASSQVGLAYPSQGEHGSEGERSLPPKVDRVHKAWSMTEMREPTFWRSFLGKRTDIQLSRLWKSFLQAVVQTNSLIQLQMKKKVFISFPRTFQQQNERTACISLSASEDWAAALIWSLLFGHDLSFSRKKTTKVKELMKMSQGHNFSSRE